MADDRSSRQPSRNVETWVRVNLSIPRHKELSVGTLRTLIRHAGMTVEGFLALL